MSPCHLGIDVAKAKLDCALRLLIFAWLLFATTANAGYVSGKVQDYSINNSNIFFFSIAGTKYQKPACDTALGQIGGRFAVSTNTQLGKDIANSIIAAKTANLDVLAVGLGKCSTWGDSEDVQYITAAGVASFNISNPPASTKTVSVCSSATQGAPSQPKNGDCRCAGKTISNVKSNESCAATSDTGSCIALGNPAYSAYGSCCVCAP